MKMRSAFDVFVRLPDGQPLLIEAVQSLEEARKCLKKVACNAPGDCFIYSEQNGIVELFVRSDVHELDYYA